MLRALFLSLLTLFLVAAPLPAMRPVIYAASLPAYGAYAEEQLSAASDATTSRARRRSRSWWRRARRVALRRQRLARYRVQQRRNNRQHQLAMLNRSRQLAMLDRSRQLAMLDRSRQLAVLRRRRYEAVTSSGNTSRRKAGFRETPLQLISARAARSGLQLAVPASWSSVQPLVAPNEMRFLVRAANGLSSGTVVISPVAVPTSTPPSSNTINAAPLTRSVRIKVLGGVPLVDLRRTVIDRMIAEGGWVINDMEREISGRRVFVVVAQSAAPRSSNSSKVINNAPGGRFSSALSSTDSAAQPLQSWTFYFTEVNGRLYHLVSNAPVEMADSLAAEAEQVLVSLQARENLDERFRAANSALR